MKTRNKPTESWVHKSKEALKNHTELIAKQAYEVGLIRGQKNKPSVENTLHILKAYQYYLMRLNYCAFDKITAQYVLDHWDEDYNLIENNNENINIQY